MAERLDSTCSVFSELEKCNVVYKLSNKRKSSRTKTIKIDLILDDKLIDKERFFLVKLEDKDRRYHSWVSVKLLVECMDVVFYYDILQNPPENVNKEIMLHFIRDISNRKPHDVLTLIKLCALIYGKTEEYINSLQLNYTELRSKAIKVLDIPIEKLNKKSHELFTLMQFSENRKRVLSNLKEWEIRINANYSPYVQVENNVDFAELPTSFEFIHDYESSYINLSEENPPVHCSCDNCYENRGFCCSENFGGHFAYNKFRRLQLLPNNNIYECNKLCKCNKDCINRVVQHGPKVKMAIFRTSNGCGWGLKTLETIHKDQFILEYLGEVIINDDAEIRGELYDHVGRTYLFDLDPSHNCVYSVDAGLKGNASHFINHSCDPNMEVYSVWINQQDPNLPRLAFFAKRKINRGEELTFDYKMADNGTSGSPLNEKDRVLCKCNSKNCKKYLY